MTIYIQSPDVLSSNFMLPMARGGAAANGAGQTSPSGMSDAEMARQSGAAAAQYAVDQARSRGGTRKTYGSCSSPYGKYTCWDKNLGLAPGEGEWVAGHCPGKTNIQCYATGPPSGGGGGGGGRTTPTTEPDSSHVVDPAVGERNKFVRNTLLYGSIFGATALGAWLLKKRMG